MAVLDVLFKAFFLYNYLSTQQRYPEERIFKENHFKRPFTIFVEGNVGSGKSTMLRYFQNRTDIDVVFEPVVQWQNFSGTDMLKNIIDDPKRWGGSFQQLSSLTRYENSLKPTTKKVRIMERSVWSGYACFLADARDRGQISPVEYALSEKWFHLMNEKIGHLIKPDLILYLRTDLETLNERIAKRGRSEEAKMDPNQLIGLQQKHDDYFYYRNSTYPLPPGAEIRVLNGSLDEEEHFKSLQGLEREIDDIIANENEQI